LDPTPANVVQKTKLAMHSATTSPAAATASLTVGESAPKAVATMPPLEEVAMLSIEVLEPASGYPVLTGATNFPDGTVVSLELLPRGTALQHWELSGNSDAANWTSIVSNNRFRLQERWIALPGLYRAVARIDPGAIKPRGPNAKRETDGWMVEAVAEFFVGTSAQSARALQEERRRYLRREIDELLVEYERIAKHGRSMERLRRSTDLAADAECGRQMRHWMDIAERTNMRCNAVLNHPDVTGDKSLAMALAYRSYAPTCVSCATWALENCTFLNSSLRATRRQLRDPSSELSWD
jgi:hypothetical protein